MNERLFPEGYFGYETDEECERGEDDEQKDMLL